MLEASSHTQPPALLQRPGQCPAAPSAKRHEQQAEGGLDTEEQTSLEAQLVGGHIVRVAV